MGKPKPPAPPDPRDTSAAQTGTNIGTTIASNTMGMVDQYNPFGSLEYEQVGSYTYNDPYTGETYQIPQYRAVQQFAPGTGAINDANMQTQYNLAQTAQNQSDFLYGYLGDGFSPGALPGFNDLPDVPGVANTPAARPLPTLPPPVQMQTRQPSVSQPVAPQPPRAAPLPGITQPPPPSGGGPRQLPTGPVAPPLPTPAPQPTPQPAPQPAPRPTVPANAPLAAQPYEAIAAGAAMPRTGTQNESPAMQAARQAEGARKLAEFMKQSSPETFAQPQPAPQPAPQPVSQPGPTLGSVIQPAQTGPTLQSAISAAPGENPLLARPRRTDAERQQLIQNLATILKR